jgi:hypothetical protein
MKNDDESIRMTGNGLQASGESGGQAAGLGLGDKKKVAVLALLFLAGAGVAAYQFLGSSGPAAATGTPPTAAPTSAASAAASSTPAANAKAGGSASDPANAENLSVDQIERLVKEFDGYVRARQVALTGLHANPFRVKAVSREPTPSAVAGGGTDAALEVPKLAMREPPPKLVLGSILVSPEKSLAMVNNQLCTIGSIVEGCRIDNIKPDRVVFSRNGDTYELMLKPRTEGMKEKASDGN